MRLRPFVPPAVLALCCSALLTAGVLPSEEAVTTANGSATAAAVAGERVRAHVEFLADDLLEGREAGTRGYDLAARYVASALKASGLEPGAGTSFYQPVKLVESTRTSARFTVRKGDGSEVDLPIPDEALVTPSPDSETTSVNAPVVYAGHGVVAPSLGHDDYAGVDVRGKVVLVFTNAPARFPSDQRAHFASTDLKRRTAADRGAVGMIVAASPDDEKRYGWEQRLVSARNPDLAWVGHDGRAGDHDPRMRAVAAVSPKGLARLFEGAPTSLESAQQSLSSKGARGFPLAVSVALEVTATHRRLDSPNVVGLLRGSDPSLAQNYVVLTAHLDHVGIGEAVNGDRIYNGAYDNASGAGVLLEVARVLAARRPAPKRSVLFVFVTAEEKGLLGSEYFARYPPVPLERLVANINFDMPLLLEPLRNVIAFGAEHSTLGAAVEQAAAAVGVTLVPDPLPEQTLFIRSDQYSFVRAGVPSIYLTTVGPMEAGGPAFLHSHYHRPSDDLALPMDLDATTRFTRVACLLTQATADGAESPRWNAGNFFGETFGK